MAFSEKPPIMSGNDREDIEKLRDYLFRMAQSLDDTLTADTSTQTAVSVSTRGDGQQVIRTGPGAATDIEAVRKNAQELKSLIVKSANNLQRQINDIEHSTFYIKYADDFAGDYPESMYNTPTEDTYYMGVCSSTEETAPTDPAAYSWSRIKGNGGTGLNSATVLLYRRAENPPARPQADLTYTFASGRLDLGPVNVSGHKLRNVSASVSGHKASSTGIEVERHLASVTGWTQEIPDSDGRPCWVITATAIATTATDVISASEWSEPKKLVEDGERGQDGQPGQNGAPGEPGQNGLNGYNTAITYLYKRADAAPTIDWQTVLWYSFADKKITTELPTGWSDIPPTHNGKPLYVTAATAASRNDVDDITASEWSAPVILAEDGAQGTQGIQGPPGVDGRTTYLHIKYSDDGQTFTVNPSTGIADGETVGAFIGTLTDYTETDSMTFSDYTWHRFADDTELRAIIADGDNAVIDYCDRKVDEYNSLYVAKSDFGTFEESITSRIETTARGIVEDYGYSSSIDSMQASIDLMQHYYTNIDGEIRRGIVEDPDTGEYVTGIAISQNLQFAGECGPSDEHNPGDGYTYYYLTSGQTFGLYTSTGWQFWIDGYKKGWFDSVDGMLHVANIIVEQALQIGSSWQLKAAADGSEFEILYVGA